MQFMNTLSIVVSYAAAAMLLWWVLEEYGVTPATKILVRWKRIATISVRPSVSLIPPIVPLLPVPAPVRAGAIGGSTAESRS